MKHFIITAMALATITTFAACSSDDTTSSAVTEQEQTQPTAISFNTYLGRSTRGTIATADNTTSVGVLGMSTSGKKYGNGQDKITGSDQAQEDAEKDFKVNFMPNTALTKPATGSIWSYNPVRYWPTASTDYITFLTYAPYSSTEKFYDASGENVVETGNLTWIKHDVNQTVGNQVDLLRSRYNLANMQYYTTKKEDGTNEVTKKADDNNAFTTVEKEDNIVNVKLVHATSRLAVAVTAPFLNDATTGENNFKVGESTSNTQITINKIVLLGDGSSATSSNPTGVFTPSAYLNLAGGVTYNETTSSADQWTYTYTDLWKHAATENKLSFSYNDFATGTYKAITHSTTPQLIWTQDGTQKTDGSQKVIKATRKVTGEGTSDSPYTYSEYSSNAVGTKASDYLFLIPQKFTSSAPLYVYIDYTIKYADVEGSAVNYTAYGKIGDSTEGQEFFAGHAYVLNIEINGTNGPKLTPIKFTVSVEAWPDEEAVSVKY